ncbi:FG-GAP-like repeat-containing protein [Fulvivirga sedimenti]|uniref:T9SS type A sorting domain-containing protein n=1 Tax=Fulvivirga sedimenti TaxID=2879465 RepID=A0A9X1HWM7_9BACT|nr:FG-GAP-like repeat-containing protein [Fulvivirga sedimenti]MCA6079001.1 T9SS type A sorting domain-containing protein [Fulvivirga sedimenti]
MCQAGVLHGQNYLSVPDIPVSEMGSTLKNPWSGGLTAPQFSMGDLNFDGVEDLILFDRYSDRVLPFVRQGDQFMYAPQYVSQFPQSLDNWVLLRDFNGDGKKDIFTSTSLGMEVYVNVGNADEGLKWRRYNDKSPAPSPLLTKGFNSIINLQLNATDIPAIDDIDSDGDLDILVFRFAGGSTVEWHRNFAVERTGLIDSMQFERVTSAWGEFRECICGTFAFNNEDCPIPGGRPAHEGGKTLLTIDMDGDGDRDVSVSEETCDELFFLRNDGTSSDALFSTLLQNPLEENGPFFPAAYYEDFSGDGTRDLVVATNWPSAQENRLERVNLFLNSGSTDNPVLTPSGDRFILDQMVDIGSMSHPAFIDYDGDGDLDMFVGNYSDGDNPEPVGSVKLYENIGTSVQPSFQKSNDDFLQLGSLQLFNIRPFFREVTGDSHLDFCFLARNAGLGNRLYVIPGSGNTANPFPGNPIVVFTELGDQDVVSIEDVNGDGIRDLLAGRVTGRVELYTGRLADGLISFSFAESDVFGLGNDNFRGATFLVKQDVDQDGTADLVRVDSRGGLAWLPESDVQNLWEEMRLFSVEDNQMFAGRNLAPVFVNLLNLNADQLVLGSGAGGLQVYKAESSVVNPPGERSFVIFPNPVVQGSRITVRSSVRSELQIIDGIGRVLGRFNDVPANTNYEIPVSRFAAGIYFLKASFQDGGTVTRQFVITR